MENYDPRRRQDEERQQARDEDRGRDRDSLWRGERTHDDDQRRRSRFSPDWSREGEEPRYSDDPYYSRNRDRDSDDYSRRDRSGGRQGNDWPYERGAQGRDEQRSREDEQGSHYRGYYSRSATPFSYGGGTGYLYSESVTLQGPYAGRGPKGYKRSDQQIVEEASQRLERDGEVDASEIEVTADDGVIRLRGTVRDRRTKRRAEECVESIYGARDVMNELRLSQTSQGPQAAQGSQASQGSQTPTPGMRPATGEQPGEDKRTPRH